MPRDDMLSCVWAHLFLALVIRKVLEQKQGLHRQRCYARKRVFWKLHGYVYSGGPLLECVLLVLGKR